MIMSWTYEECMWLQDLLKIKVVAAANGEPACASLGVVIGLH